MPFEGAAFNRVIILGSGADKRIMPAMIAAVEWFGTSSRRIQAALGLLAGARPRTASKPAANARKICLFKNPAVE